jgi:hypothetical protein
MTDAGRYWLERESQAWLRSGGLMWGIGVCVHIYFVSNVFQIIWIERMLFAYFGQGFVLPPGFEASGLLHRCHYNGPHPKP